MCQSEQQTLKPLVMADDKAPQKAIVASPENHNNMPSSSRFSIPPLLLIAMIPLAPAWFFLNRGYTQWWHWCMIFCFLTGEPEVWRRFVVIQGISVQFGWYSTVIHDFIFNGNWCHLLYNNVPPVVRANMLVNGRLASGGFLSDDPLRVATMIFGSHIIDILAHPLALYICWKRFTAKGGKFRDLMSSWDAWWGTLLLTRVWSIVHQYYNDGKANGLFYYGHDVYNTDRLESYTIAYAGEASVHVFLAFYKMYLNYLESQNQQSGVTRESKKMGETTERPKLIQSESTFSANSSCSEILTEQ